MDDLPESVSKRVSLLEKALTDEISKEEVVLLLAQAKREAHADVLGLLRDMYKRALLDAAIAQDELLREVDVIKSRIAENERFLLHRPAPSTAEEPPAGKPAALPAPVTEVATSIEREPAPEVGSEPAPEGPAYYVYGLVKVEESTEFLLNSPGVSAEQPVGLVSMNGLAAVASVVSLDEFGQDELEANLEDPEWTEAKVRAHHEVLNELLFKGMCPVPLRFCTIFQSADRVHGMLREYGEEVTAALHKLGQKAEWGVKVFCDQTAARRWVEDEARTAGAVEEEIGAAGAGAAYFLRKKLEKTLCERVERVADTAAQTSHETLAGLSAESAILALQGRETTGRAEAMLLNGAYLVSDESFPEFEAAVDQLTRDWAPCGCLFELTGPWPAYNFSGVDAAEVVNE